MRILLFLLSLPLCWNCLAQSAFHKFDWEFKNPSQDRGKPVIYNAFGLGALGSGSATNEAMFGGNHVSFRKRGFGFSWRASVRNIRETKGKTISGLAYDTALKNGWVTGNTLTTFGYSINVNYVWAITHKIPIYGGIGVTRQRKLHEVNLFGLSTQTVWIPDDNETKFRFNYGIGTFIPLSNRVILNLQYDHLPETLFIGIAIGGPFNYQDIDMW